jgi:hypothetical protein
MNQPKKKNQIFFNYQSTPEKKITNFSITKQTQKKKKNSELPGENEWQKKEELENQRLEFLTK